LQLKFSNFTNFSLIFSTAKVIVIQIPFEFFCGKQSNSKQTQKSEQLAT